MNRLQQALVWLRRIGHCRGFGIQSPTDYHFVREVVNEEWPYYAYAELGQDDPRLRQKLGHLYFRLANFLQPECVADLLGYEDYLHAGCQKACICHDMSEQASLILAPVESSPLLASFQPSSPKTVLMVENIGQHPDEWQTILANTYARVAFDLYYAGIVFFDPKRSRQHYIVNF